jgi:hypothetical protein
VTELRLWARQWLDQPAPQHQEFSI